MAWPRRRALEKSGSVVNPTAFRTLFPDLQDEDFPFRRPVEKEALYLLRKNGSIRLPTPPTMQNGGNYIASICEMVRWLASKAEEAGVDVFAGFPAESLLVDDDRVIGVRTAATGLDRDGGVAWTSYIDHLPDWFQQFRPAPWQSFTLTTRP